MQPKNFTQKLLRQRRYLSSLIPLLALFVGLGASQSALAQITDNAVTLNVRGTSGTFNTQASTASTTNFFDQDFGTFDSSVPSHVFQITGATLTIQETAGGAQYDQGELLFRVFPGTLATAATVTSPAFASIDLGAGVLGAGNVRTFTLSAANQNLLASAVGSASPGTSNRFDVRFRATDNFVTGGSLVSLIRRSVFTRITPVPNGVTFSGQTVIVDQGAGSVTRTAPAFNGAVLNDQKSGSTTTPAFDINTGTLVLKGGSITTTATGTSVVSGVNLNYVVYAPGPSFAIVANGMLQLSPTGPVAGGVRTFGLTTGTVNVIVPIQTAGTGYSLSISYQATFQNAGGFPNTATDNNGGPGYNATFNVTGTKTPPSTVSANTISIAPNGGADVVYGINPPGSRPFNGANLSAPANSGTDYDVNNGQLRLNATTVTTTEAGGNTISSVILYYRTRLFGSGGGAYQPLTLTQSGNTVGGVRTFVLDPSLAGANPQPNLIATAAVTVAGTYTLDVYYQANGVNSTGTPFTITDPPGAPASAPYSANFTVAGTPFGTTIWTGSLNDNWFDTRNWSNGVPTESINAQVRDLGAGNSVPYPNIYSDVERRTAGGALLYSNVGSGPAKARDLIMGGSSQAARSIARLQVGQLQVFGDFDNTYDSFIQRENTIMQFAGVNQAITGGSFFRVDISGGGTKSLAGVMNIQASLNFLTGVTTGDEPAVTNSYTASNANAGILTTNIAVPTASLVVLADRALTNANNGAQLTGETEASFLFGFARTSRVGVLATETRTYGNMGMTITFGVPNNPGTVEVTRNTVEAYTPVSGRFGIRRIFGVRPSNAAIAGGLVATMIFRYRDAETMGLNGPNTITPGTGTIPENRLVLFVSSNGGNTFTFLGRDGVVDQANNIVTKSGVRTFATFTLGDQQNPLPVRLTAFDAARVGKDALVTWQTASEENSRSYDVQVSTNGTEFRTLTSVPSAAPNTVRLTSYSYLDTEENKSGLRYYRLRQVDLDGKDAFFAPKAVSFEGKAPATTLVAYPNPFDGNDQLHIAMQSVAAGKAQVRITDMTGRVIRQEAVEVTKGLTDLSVSGVSELKAGLYLVNVTLPTGEVKNVKVMKQ